MSTAESRALRSQIRALTAEYYRATWGDPAPFVPGETRLAYGGRVFDHEELDLLVDASLDFWLTYGRVFGAVRARTRRLSRPATLRPCQLGLVSEPPCLHGAHIAELGERRIERGDEVITVAAGFPTTVAPIVQYRAVPVFVDVRADTANVDVDALAAAVGRRTKAVFLAHTLGVPFDVDAGAEASASGTASG